ncbi:hypothetical protein B0A27_004564 [Salmonella enterica subsp. enterica serovar Reading]|nr:hypothetical protein [Salmonella enterica subsp. enterica serovar Reading]
MLPFLPVCCRDRTERVLAVRTMRRYGKWSGFSGRSDTNNSTYRKLKNQSIPLSTPYAT